MGYIDAVKLAEIRKEINDQMENEFKMKSDLNRDFSKTKCAKILISMFNSFPLPNILNVD